VSLLAIAALSLHMTDLLPCYIKEVDIFLGVGVMDLPLAL
jgi:hypothetical protein